MGLDDVTYAALGTITKFHRASDGTLVFDASKATGGDLDIDGQRCDETWAARAMEEWLSTGGNLREMHASTAAGKALTLEHRADGEWITGEVVDPTSALKVEKGVLGGLSIGIKGAQVVKADDAPNGRIVGGRIVEVSLVDRPANPTCKLTLGKAAADGSFQQVEELTETSEGAAQVKAALAEVTKAKIACPSCGALTKDKFSFCPNCGKALPAAAGKTATTDIKKAEEATVTTETAPKAKGGAKKIRKMIDEALAQFKAELPDIVKTAVPDATKAAAASEDLAKIEARLAQVEKAAAPGGPSRLAPQAPVESDRDKHLKAAAALRLKADAETDKELADGYRQRAREAETLAKTA